MPRTVLSVRVTMRYDDGAIRNMLQAPTGMVGRYLNTIGNEVNSEARRLAPHRTGRLAGSIHSDVGGRGGSLQVVVSANAPYSRFVHEGTGFYGPFGRPITARRGRFMSWEQGGQRIYARAVEGQAPNPFLVRAMQAVMARH